MLLEQRLDLDTLKEQQNPTLLTFGKVRIPVTGGFPQQRVNNANVVTPGRFNCKTRIFFYHFLLIFKLRKDQDQAAFADHSNIMTVCNRYLWRRRGISKFLFVILKLPQDGANCC